MSLKVTWNLVLYVCGMWKLTTNQKIKLLRNIQPKSDIIECPYCTEGIKIKAKKCKHFCECIKLEDLI